MSPRWVVALALAGSIALLGSLSAEDESELTPILRPVLEGVEPAVAALLRERLDRLDAALAGDAEVDLAGEFGELGKLFLIYNLPESAESCLVNAARLAPEEFSWVYLGGAVRQNRGDLEGAREVLETARKLVPDDPSLLLRLAQIAFELGAPERAESLYRLVVERAGFGAAAHYGLGRIELGRGAVEEAVEHFEAGLAEQPHASQIRYQLGSAYRRLGDRDRAIEYLSNSGAGQLRFPDPLLETLGSAAAGVEVYLAAGRKARNRGDHEGAIVAFQQAVETEPEDAENWAVLGATLFEMERIEASVRAYREVQRLEPENPKMLYNLALGLLRLGEPEEAVALLEVLVAGEPDHVDARVNLATLYEQAGRPSEAEALVGQAIELDPYDSGLRIHLASLQLTQNRAGDARRQLVELLREDVGNAEAMLLLGAANEALGSTGDAVATWRRVLAFEVAAEMRARAHFFLGRTALRQGSPGEAVAELESAVELLPESRQLRLTLAGALAASGDYARAIEHYDRAIAADSGDEGARFGKAMSLLLSGRELQARDHLRESLGAVPESLALEHLLARLLATAADPAARDGAEALRLAQEVFGRAQTPDHAETIAMALAELGRFESAVEWQSQIIERVRAAGESQRLSELVARRAALQRGEPVRTPWQP